ncbi:MAG: S41 family peptidase [Parcubacteria group bacterium]|nr:S41 family peptidase [Parcubacteria group bacterium]
MRRVIKILFGLAFSIALFSAGLFVGYREAKLEVLATPPRASDGATIVNTTGAPREVDFGLFWQAWNVLSTKYLRKPLPAQELLYGAIQGAVAALGDPYTVFLDPKTNEAFNEELSGTFDGIGAEIGIRNDQTTIIAPLKDSPAEKAGVQPGDVILRIDDEDTTGLLLEEAVTKIRGPKGSTVKLTLMRNHDRNQILELTMVRNTIRVASVSWTFRPDDILLIESSRFGEDVATRFDELAREAKEKEIKGVILDLRNNAGGFLDAAVVMASEFIREGVIVIDHRPGQEDSALTAHGKGRFLEVPLVLLVNEGSASASEIVTGAIQDYKRGTAVGTKTFGKGSVQELETLPQGTALKVTVAEWLTPKRRQINEVGLEPDVVVERTDEDINADRDPQLEKAIELLSRNF